VPQISKVELKIINCFTVETGNRKPCHRTDY